MEHVFLLVNSVYQESRSAYHSQKHSRHSRVQLLRDMAGLSQADGFVRFSPCQSILRRFNNGGPDDLYDFSAVLGQILRDLESDDKCL